MVPEKRPFMSSPAEIGVCDPCAYVLGHAWRRELGQLVRATSPRVARTYVLVPRLPAGRSETDIASYEFLTTSDGGLPHASFTKSSILRSWLQDAFGCVTWEPVFRQCYLGYAASGDFSEVVLAGAWGKEPGSKTWRSFATFGELLGKPTPDAGFYLGVKAAFEGLLWRREVQPEGNALCTFMREPAMRYLAAQLAGERSEEDPAMVEMFRTMMTADELEVARLATEVGRQARAVPPAVLESKKEAAEEPATDVPGLLDGVEEEETGGERQAGEPGDDVPEGFARPRRSGT
jgi:hypothetical protein